VGHARRAIRIARIAGISPFQAVPGKVLSDSSLRRYLRAGLETLTFRLEAAGTVIR
jgi:hypothetical protein